MRLRRNIPEPPVTPPGETSTVPNQADGRERSDCLEVSFVGPNLLCRALAEMIQGRTLQGVSITCLPHPDGDEDAAGNAPDVLVYIPAGNEPVHDLPAARFHRGEAGPAGTVLLRSESDEGKPLLPAVDSPHLAKTTVICLSLETSAEELVDGILAAAGQRPMPTVPNSGASSQRNRVPQELPLPVPLLTPREEELAQLAARGLSNAEIAGQLYIALPTVKWHLKRVFLKLKIARRSQLSQLPLFRKTLL